MFTVSGFVCFSNSAYVCAQSGVSFPGYGFVQVMHLENFKTFFFPMFARAFFSLSDLGIQGTQHQNRGQAKGKERFCTLALTSPVIIFPVHAKSVNDYCN